MQYADVRCIMLACQKFVYTYPADVCSLLHDSQRLDVMRKFYFVLLKLRELYELCVSVDYVSPMKSQ